MAGTLPPFPQNSPPGSFLWIDWYRKLQNFIQGVATLSWSTIDKTDSNLTDLQTRNHNDLQNIQGGDGSAEYFHLTEAQYLNLPSTYVDEFTELTDVPGTYAGASGYTVKVNAGETGLEFVAPDPPYELPAGVVLNLTVVGTNLEFDESNGDGTTTHRIIPI